MLKSNKVFVWSVCASVIFSASINYAYFKSTRLIYTCSSELTMAYPDGYRIYASFIGFNYSDGSGLSTYRGTVINGDKEYILNSDMPYRIQGAKVKSITYGQTVKKNNDTVPEDITFKKMLSKDSTYYLSFYASPDGDVIVKDRGSVTYICSH